MTTLAARPVDADQLDMLALIADEVSPLGKVHAADFKAACREDAREHEGWVHPSRVSAILHARFAEVNPRWLSSMWSSACSPNGFLDKTDVPAPIDPTHSRGNGNKSTVYRKWRVAADDLDWREALVSKCEYGCKVYRHGITGEFRTFHNRAYGCNA